MGVQNRMKPMHPGEVLRDRCGESCHLAADRDLIGEVSPRRRRKLRASLCGSRGHQPPLRRMSSATEAQTAL